MICVILTRAQANALRGPYSTTAALDPVELADGTFALPARCLAEYAEARGKDAAPVVTLLGRTRRDLVDADFKAPPEDAVEFAKVAVAEAAKYDNLLTGLPVMKLAETIKGAEIDGAAEGAP